MFFPIKIIYEILVVKDTLEWLMPICLSTSKPLCKPKAFVTKSLKNYDSSNPNKLKSLKVAKWRMMKDYGDEGDEGEWLILKG